MHTLRNRVIFFGGTMAAGALNLVLNRYMLENLIDSKGLLVAGSLAQTLVWVVAVAFAVGMGLMLRTIGGEGTYEDNFPPCMLSGSLLMAAGVLLALSVHDMVLDWPALMVTVMTMKILRAAQWATKLLLWLAAVSMVVLGGLRMMGKRPWPVFSGIITLFYMVTLVNNYRLWSADPQLHTYAWQLLAEVLLMLCAFHRTCCDAGIIQRRKLLATGLGAAFCCMAALSRDFQWGFFLASGLWAAGCQCNVAVLPPDPEEEPEEPVEETESE